MEELENLVCQTQEQLEVAQKIMADEKDRRSLSYQKIVDQTGIPKSTAERFLGLKSSNSSTVYFIVLCKLFGMSADSFFDITKESPTSQETDRAAHEIELLQLKNKYLERNNVFLRKAVEKKNLYIAVISILSLILLIRNTVMDMNDHHIGFFRGDWTPMSTAGALLIVIAAVICIVAIIANLGSRAHGKKEESKDQDL
jgi:hypothetical protein